MVKPSNCNFEIMLKNSPEEVSNAIYRFLEFCNDQKFSLALIYKLRLAMEEILVNTINYSFRDQTEHDIFVRIKCCNESVVVVFEDDGIEFNPLNVPEPQDIPLEERIPGGVGIYLVKTMMDTFEYERKNGKNILTISKKTTQ